MTEAEKKAKKREYMRAYRARKKAEKDLGLKSTHVDSKRRNYGWLNGATFYQDVADGKIDLSQYQEVIENTPLILREIAHLVMSRTKLIDSHNGKVKEYDNICFADLIAQNSPLLNREVLAIRCDTKYRIKILIG